MVLLTADSDSVGLGWACDLSFLTSFQVIAILLVHGLHFEKQRTKGKPSGEGAAQNNGRGLGGRSVAIVAERA